MRPLITPSAMQAMEARYFSETGIPSLELMERAAQALCRALVSRYGRERRVIFACGPGGNGGDGYACARLYAQSGGDCAIAAAAPPRSADAIENALRAREMGIPEIAPEDLQSPPDVWVDALYGTGLSRAPEGQAAKLIDRMNADRAAGSRILSVDIPSGLNGASGSAWPVCAQADVTITFQLAKTGHFLGDGLDRCGELEVADIGIPERFYPADLHGLMDDGELRRLLPPRPRNIHKGKCGHLLIVAGSRGMAGAAVMCAQAALRSGAGLVTVACPDSIVPILQTLAPCAMCVALPEQDSAIAGEAAGMLECALHGKDALVCGCGLSTGIPFEILRILLTCGLPALFDADALNLIAANAALAKPLLRPCHLITPHPGEAARLLGRGAADPIADAFALRKMGCQALLKGAVSLIPVGNRAWLSASGCCGMARGGSGDILSGITGALMAERAAREGTAALTGDALAECAAAASELHGLAGELAQRRLGVRGMCAQDIISELPEVFRRYEP